MPISGYLIASFGWEYVFYVTGAVGLIWSLAWFMLIYDTPAQHPRISDDERNYIESSIGNTITKRVSFCFISFFDVLFVYLFIFIF